MKKILFVMAVALMACGSAMAQRQQMTQEQREQRRAEMVKAQTERMSKELKVEGDAKTAFEESYTKYMNELNATMDMDQQRRGRDEETRAEKMTDEECYAKIKESLEQQEKQVEQSQKRLEITKKYMAEMMTILTPQQLYKVFGQRQRMGFGGQGFGGGQRGGFGGQGGFGGGQRGGFGGGQGSFGGGF